MDTSLARCRAHCRREYQLAEPNLEAVVYAADVAFMNLQAYSADMHRHPFWHALQHLNGYCACR